MWRNAASQPFKDPVLLQYLPYLHHHELRIALAGPYEHASPEPLVLPIRGLKPRHCSEVILLRIDNVPGRESLQHFRRAMPYSTIPNFDANTIFGLDHISGINLSQPALLN